MNPSLLCALAAQRRQELHDEDAPTRRAPTRQRVGGHLAMRRRVRRSVGWVLVEVGLKLAVDDPAGPEHSTGRSARQAA